MANILIVDDTASIRHLVKSVLQRQGHTVREAREGKTGLEQATSQPPDLLILDIGLPDISGIDVAQQLRASPLLRDLPILMLTGLSSTDYMVASLQVADDYVTKPFEKRELLARVDVLLRRYHNDQRLKGRLEHIGGAATLMQTVAKSGNGGLVFDDGSIVYFEKGYVVHAEHGAEPERATPMDVLRNIFNREEGAFHFDPSLRPVANSMAREPTALLLEAASHYDEINRNDVVLTLNTSERLIANQDIANQDIANQNIANQDIANQNIASQDIAYRQQDSAYSQQNRVYKQNAFQRQAAANPATSSESSETPPKRKPRHVDISNLTLSSLAVVETLAEALSYIEGLHGKQPFQVSEHVDPDTNAPYLLFDSGDVKIVAQDSHITNISPETSELLKLEFLD
jgi:DNA-binding response OmpR family regulator